MSKPPTYDATHICTVETHIVVACPVTIWKLPDGTHTATFGNPYPADENPFANDGEIWDSKLEDWMTTTRLADTYDIPQSAALNAAVGPNLILDTEESNDGLNADLEGLWNYIEPNNPDSGPSAADVCDALYGILNKHGWPIP